MRHRIDTLGAAGITVLELLERDVLDPEHWQLPWPLVNDRVVIVDIDGPTYRTIFGPGFAEQQRIAAERDDQGITWSIQIGDSDD
ncbi:hypothetical protein SEA_VANLEE_52 [Gordonia phage VanLee]|uniref:Uncharacterized protein n=1 Tax=Gordonia phage VanLee TaxID=2845816 RepID=A0A8F2D9E0_9CAUD|nr:hypothetical protein QEH49_gp052 [Gordonia phage VanLee]QWS68169.1 hypothetical protein SEA_VANLEE_52 [Gordonia phage VanLee]